GRRLGDRGTAQGTGELLDRSDLLGEVRRTAEDRYLHLKATRGDGAAGWRGLVEHVLGGAEHRVGVGVDLPHDDLAGQAAGDRGGDGARAVGGDGNVHPHPAAVDE